MTREERLADAQRKKRLYDAQQQQRRQQQAQQRAEMGAPEGGTGAGAYAAFANRPAYQSYRPYRNPDFEPTVGDRIRQAASGAAFGWADELEAGIRAPFSDRSYEDIQRELDWRQRYYRVNDPVMANLTELSGGLLGGGAVTGGVKQLARVPGVTPALQTAGNVIGPKGRAAAQYSGVPAGYGAVAGAGYSQPGQRAEGATTGALVGGVAGPVMSGMGAGTRRTLDEATKDRFPGVNIGTGADAQPLGSLVSRFPNSSLARFSRSFFDRMLGSDAYNRTLNLVRNQPERIVAQARPGEEALQRQLVNVLRGRTARDADDVVRAGFEARQAAIAQTKKAADDAIDAKATVESRRLRDVKDRLDDRIETQRDVRKQQLETGEQVAQANLTRANQNQLVQDAVPPTATPEQRAAINNLRPLDANRAISDLWDTTNPWGMISGQRYAVSQQRLIDDAVVAAGRLGTNQKAQIRREVEQTLAEILPEGAPDLSTLTGPQLMDVRNSLARAANAINPVTGQRSIAEQSFRRASKDIEEQLLAPLSQENREQFRNTLTAYGQRQRLRDTTDATLSTQQGRVTPENAVRAISRREHSAALEGRATGQQRQYDVQDESALLKDTLAAQKRQQDEIAKRRKTAVSRGAIRRSDQIDDTKQLAKSQAAQRKLDEEAALRSERGKTKQLMDDLKEQLRKATPEAPNVFAAKATAGMALAAAGGFMGGTPGLLGAALLGYGVSRPGFTRMLAGQTAPQRGVQKLLDRYGASQRAQAATANTADALRRQGIANLVTRQQPLTPLEE